MCTEFDFMFCFCLLFILLIFKGQMQQEAALATVSCCKPVPTFQQGNQLQLEALSSAFVNKTICAVHSMKSCHAITPSLFDKTMGVHFVAQ